MFYKIKTQNINLINPCKRKKYIKKNGIWILTSSNLWRFSHFDTKSNELTNIGLWMPQILIDFIRYFLFKPSERTCKRNQNPKNDLGALNSTEYQQYMYIKEMIYLGDAAEFYCGRPGCFLQSPFESYFFYKPMQVSETWLRKKSLSLSINSIT